MLSLLFRFILTFGVLSRCLAASSSSRPQQQLLRREAPDESHHRDFNESDFIGRLAPSGHTNLFRGSPFLPEQMEKECLQLAASADKRSVSQSEIIQECQRGGVTIGGCDRVIVFLLGSNQSAYTAATLSAACRIRKVAQEEVAARVPTMLGAPSADTKEQETKSVLLELEKRAGRSLLASGTSSSSAALYSHILALDRVALPKLRIVKPASECNSSRVFKGRQPNLGACADAVRADGGKFLAFGKGSRAGLCYEEHTTSRGNATSDMYGVCPEGWKPMPGMDFFALDNKSTGCERPSESWCTNPYDHYSWTDCDSDKLPDPYCQNVMTGTSSFISSSRSCVEAGPLAPCDPRRLVMSTLATNTTTPLSNDSNLTNYSNLACISLSDNSLQLNDSQIYVILAPCAAGYVELQRWFFVGNYSGGKFLKPAASPSLCLSESADHTIAMEMSCRDDDRLRWVLEPEGRLRNVWSSRCLRRRTQVEPLLTETCDQQQYSDQYISFQPARNCRWSEWGVWSTCSTTCGEGSRHRYRFVAEAAALGGAGCVGNSSLLAPCRALNACPRDCVWDEWEDWSPCSASCGTNGTRSRGRRVRAMAEYGGENCTGETTMLMACQPPECPVHCQFGDWTNWSVCQAPCGKSGKFTRSRVVQVAAKFGGLECVGPANSSAVCVALPCQQDCSWNPWSQWTTCPATCGDFAMRKRKRTVNKSADFGGKPCVGDFIDLDSCSLKPCPQDCAWESWEDWGECSLTCGVKVALRTRTRGSKPDLFGGKACQGAAKEETFCNSFECPVDCRWSKWSEWGFCLKRTTYGGRYHRKRFRTRALNNEFGGRLCEQPSNELQTCQPDEQVTSTTTTTPRGWISWLRRPR